MSITQTDPHRQTYIIQTTNIINYKYHNYRISYYYNNCYKYYYYYTTTTITDTTTTINYYI